ncbi:glycosyl hydrolase family 28-related protein [Kineococcus sp. TBRC 1896]|uniref:Glycosyl hydrolase family 28-related protein n=1 Tax=Kineococcus mangrovi TaxID=1660183 RepID=A0ABV4HWX6_9ACTN
MQAAIEVAHAGGGGVVRLSRGTYLTEAPIRLRSGVALRGDGSGTVLKAGPDFLSRTGPHGGHPLLTTEGADDVTIAALTADHSGDALDADVPGRLVEYLVDGRHSENLLLEEVTTCNPFTYSIAIVGSSRFSVRGCRTSVSTSGRYTQLDGIHVLGSRYGEVIGNDVDQGGGDDGDDGLVAHTITQPCHDVVFRDNRVRGGRHGSAMQLAVGGATLHDVVVRNNFFYDSPRGLRSGQWSAGGMLRRVIVGGDAAGGNAFWNNGGAAVDFAEVPTEDVVVSHNTSVASGEFLGRTGTLLRANSVAGV